MPRHHDFSERPAERGYVLIGGLILIVIVAALLASYTFIAQHNARAEANYAIGEHLADIAIMAHARAQAACYRGPQPCDAANPMDKGLVYSEIFVANENTFTVEVRGTANAPLEGPATRFVAPSAMMLVHIRNRANDPSSTPRLSNTDMVNILRGGTRKGMARVGIARTGTAAAVENCNASTTTNYRWGPEDAACLSAPDTAYGFNMMPSKGGIDLMVPTWEAALSQTAKKALFRYPQPGRPDLSTMHANLQMSPVGATNDIGNIATTDAQDMNAALDLDPTKNYRVEMRDKMNVRETAAAGFDQDVTVANTASADPFRVYDRTNPANTGGPSMHVDGPVTLDNGDLSVGETMTVPGPTPASVNVKIVDPVATDVLGNTNIDMVVSQVPASTAPIQVTVQSVDATSSINDTFIQGASSRLNVTGALNTNRLSPGQNLIGGTPGANLYTAALTAGTAPSTTVENLAHRANNFAPNIPWDIGTIDQKNTGQLKVDSVKTEDCTGYACPDNVTTAPGGGI